MVELGLEFGSTPAGLIRRARGFLSYVIIYAAALYGSIPLFSASSIPSGYDAVMHFSKIRVFSRFFPSIPRWFPWWYCGTHSLRFYPPLSYFVASSVGWLSTSALEGYRFADFFSFCLTGLFIYHFMKVLTNSSLAGVSSAILYMLSPQTLYGRFFVGHFTHNFSMFLIPLTLFCIMRWKDNTKTMALITAPLFSLIFLSHLQTALSFGFMLGIYIFISLIVRWWKEEFERVSISGIFLGGAIGALLAGFWLLPCLLEGAEMRRLTGEIALRIKPPIESLFVEATNPWHKALFLGFPLIFLFLLAIGLIVRRKLDAKRTFWGIIFASWIAFFLFAVVSPRIGLVFGDPNRVAYFISMPMAMLAGLAVNWIQNHVLPFFAGTHRKWLGSYCLLTVVILSVSIHTFNVEQFAMKRTYANATEVSKWFSNLNLKPGERVASFGLFSYVYNINSDNWQLDGGYFRGHINQEFYYDYWLNLTTVDNVEDILQTLNKTNNRYIVFQRGSEIPLTYGNQTFFERIDMYGFTIFKLRDNYSLNFVEVTKGKASVTYSYLDPDELSVRVRDCSEEATLIVKMNYYPGWVADSSDGNVRLTEDSDGLMKIDITGSDNLDINLQYGYTIIDHVALGTSIIGAAIYIFLLVERFFRGAGNGRSRAKRQGKYNW